MSVQNENSEIMALMGDAEFRGEIMFLSNVKLQGRSYRDFQPFNLISSHQLVLINKGETQEDIFNCFKQILPHAIKKGVLDQELNINEVKALELAIRLKIKKMLQHSSVGKTALEVEVLNEKVNLNLIEKNDFTIFNYNNFHKLLEEANNLNLPLFFSMD